MADQINLQDARQYLIELTLQAGDILKKYFESSKFTSQYPKTFILTEETAPEDYSSLKNKENVWIVDPIDGTVNFSRHHKNFAISIGLVDKGISKLGVVYAPLENNLYWAQADEEGAFLNEKPITVSTTRDLKETVLGCDWGWKVERRLIAVEWLKDIVTSVRQVKCMGSGVADLASLAAGKIDVYIHSDLRPWDVAAVSLIIEKAGGKITTPTGENWNVFTPEIVASNGILHDDILGLVNK